LGSRCADVSTRDTATPLAACTRPCLVPLGLVLAVGGGVTQHSSQQQVESLLVRQAQGRPRAFTGPNPLACSAVATLHRGSVSIIVYDTEQVVYSGIEYTHPAVLEDLGAFTSSKESSLACTCPQTTVHMQFWVCYCAHAGAHLGVIVSVLCYYHLRTTPTTAACIGL
jgi:hypothetical protein